MNTIPSMCKLKVNQNLNCCVVVALSDSLNYAMAKFIFVAPTTVPIHYLLNYSIQLITGHYGDVMIWMVVLDNESLSFGPEWGQASIAMRLTV